MTFEIATLYAKCFLLALATYCQYDNSFQLDNGWYLLFSYVTHSAVDAASGEGEPFYKSGNLSLLNRSHLFTKQPHGAECSLLIPCILRAANYYEFRRIITDFNK